MCNCRITVLEKTTLSLQFANPDCLISDLRFNKPTSEVVVGYMLQSPKKGGGLSKPMPRNIDLPYSFCPFCGEDLALSLLD